MKLEVTGRIVSVGRLQAFSKGSSVMVLIAESADNSSILPIEFYGDDIHQTVLVTSGQSVKVYFEIIGKNYLGRDGRSKNLAVLRGEKIEPENERPVTDSPETLIAE